MTRRRVLWGVLLLAAVTAPGSAALGAPPAGGDRAAPTACDTAAGDPDPAVDSDAWKARDEQNRACTSQRDQDQKANPRFIEARDAEAQQTYRDSWAEQLAHLDRPRLTFPYLFPANYYPGDPFRTVTSWVAQKRGRAQRVEFVATSGAHLVGTVFAPPSGSGPMPVVAFTTGSIQGFQEAYNAFYEGLAEEGYLVLSYDVQGQGHSETFGHTADGLPGCCDGVPFQRQENFDQGTRDAITFLLSNPSTPYAASVAAARGANADGTNSFNPWWRLVDRTRLGIAGHSWGAAAVGLVGQQDARVKAIVGFDAMQPLPADVVPHAPALNITTEQLYFPNQPENPPDPETNGLDGTKPRELYDRLRKAGVDAGLITQRSSQHNESSYGGSSQASRYGERVAFYYTLAWFDRYLKGDPDGTRRLAAIRLDGSADRSSIGAGTYDAAHDRNLPYKVAGDCAANRVSIYYRSSLSLEKGAIEIPSVRARGCPRAAP